MYVVYTQHVDKLTYLIKKNNEMILHFLICKVLGDSFSTFDTLFNVFYDPGRCLEKLAMETWVLLNH